jgi:hypothetical protein
MSQLSNNAFPTPALKQSCAIPASIPVTNKKALALLFPEITSAFLPSQNSPTQHSPAANYFQVPQPS